MKFALLILVTCGAVFAKENKADAAAQKAWEQVEASPLPAPPALYECVVTGIEVVKKGRKERTVTSPRQAFCRLFLAISIHDEAALKKTPDDFAAARAESHSESAPLLNLLAALAHLQMGEDPGADLDNALRATDCDNAGFAKARTCAAIVKAGYLWQGWLALKKNDRQTAGEAFQHVNGGHWSAWYQGLSDVDAKRWADAVPELSNAAKAWSEQKPAENLTDLLAPKPPDLGDVYAKLGYAQFMSGQLQAAIPDLDRAIAARPSDAFSLFLRARVRESLGLPNPALVDLQAATEAAPTEHFYRGVMLERQGNFADAAKELAQASGPDVTAWKLMAEAAAGACAPDAMDQAASEASVLFPRNEVTALALECRLRQAASLEQLLGLDASLRARYKDPAAMDRVATAYIRLGVEAEDKKDAYAAVIAYRRGLEWSPTNTKARFNLASVYIGDQKYELAEREYRALLAADPADYEAQYWLAQSILGARPSAPRKAEACDLLRKSLQITDASRRAEFALSLRAAKCPDH